MNNQLTVGGTFVRAIYYGYDVYGNLVWKGVGGVVTRYAFEITDKSPGFVASVNTLWAELNNAGAVTLRYMTVGDETVARSDGANLYWLLADRQGSTRDITTAAGVFVGHVEYTTFGGILSESNAAVSGNVLFTGGLYDRLTGLYGMHWRSYDPQSGQWTSEDPLPEPDHVLRRQ